MPALPVVSRLQRSGVGESVTRGWALARWSTSPAASRLPPSEGGLGAGAWSIRGEMYSPSGEFCPSRLRRGIRAGVWSIRGEMYSPSGEFCPSRLRRGIRAGVWSIRGEMYSPSSEFCPSRLRRGIGAGMWSGRGGIFSSPATSVPRVLEGAGALRRLLQGTMDAVCPGRGAVHRPSFSTADCCRGLWTPSGGTAVGLRADPRFPWIDGRVAELNASRVGGQVVPAKFHETDKLR